METRLVAAACSGQWNDFVERVPHSIAWQRWEWSELVRAHFGCEFLPLAAWEGKDLRGVLPLYRVKGPRGRARLMSVPYAVAGGILAEGEEVAASLLAEAIRLSDAGGGLPLALKQYKVAVPGALRTDQGYFNRELDLSPGQEEIWRGMAPVNRERLGRTEGAALRLEFPSPDVDALYRLLARHQHRSGIPVVGRQWISDLVRLGMYQVALLHGEVAPLAGTLVKTFKKTVSFPFTCHRDPGPAGEDMAYRLYWELMRDRAAGGIQICHSGRLPLEGEVEPYRQGWGGTPFPYHYQYHPPTVGRTESSKRGRKRLYFQIAWKMLPAPLADLLGPRVAGMFP